MKCFSRVNVAIRLAGRRTRSPLERPRCRFCLLSTRGSWSHAQPARQPWDFGIPHPKSAAIEVINLPLKAHIPAQEGLGLQRSLPGVAPLPSPAPRELRQRFLGVKPRTWGLLKKQTQAHPPSHCCSSSCGSAALGTDVCDSVEGKSKLL